MLLPTCSCIFDLYLSGFCCLRKGFQIPFEKHLNNFGKQKGKGKSFASHCSWPRGPFFLLSACSAQQPASTSGRSPPPFPLCLADEPGPCGRLPPRTGLGSDMALTEPRVSSRPGATRTPLPPIKCIAPCPRRSFDLWCTRCLAFEQPQQP